MPAQKPYLIGMTGNIACGKSTVLAELARRGAAVIDADRVTHDLQQPGQPVYTQIVEAFGPQVASEPGGPLDRKRLASIVFSDAEALRRLEAIVHPAVRAAVFGWLAGVSEQGAARVAVVDAIKLLEAGWKERCQEIWVVTCAPEQQAERLIANRGMSPEEARMRIEAQPPQAAKLAQADVVIDNSGPLEDTLAQVARAWARVAAIVG